MDFNRTIFENRMERKAPFLAAHRGICGGNIPCNTLAAYKIAVDQGADVVEIDVTKSRDGVFFVFHPFMEPVFLQGGKLITEMTAEEVANNMSLTRERVRQIKERALRRLREADNINILVKYLG